jgi:O-antigen ligase
MSARLDKAIAGGLIFALAFTALAHGAVEPWSLAIFESIVLALVIAWAVKAAADRRLVINVPKTALPIAAMVLLGLAQSISYMSAGVRRSLSMDVEATRMAVTVLMFLLASFIIAANFFDTRERLVKAASFLAIFGLAIAVFALIQRFTWDGRVYWFRPTRLYTVFGPFANRNHYAGYMEMLVPLPVALIIGRAVRKELWLLFGFAAVVMGLTVVVSLSRGGMVSLIAGMIFMAVGSRRLEKNEGVSMKDERKSMARLRFIPRLSPSVLRVAALAAMVAAITAGVVWTGAEGVINRAAQSIDQMNSVNAPGDLFSRTEVWKDTLSLIRANPITGVGAYETVFPVYGRNNGMFIINFAHNDYLQSLADGGLLGGLAAVCFVVLLLKAMLRALKSEDRRLAAIALGSGAGIFSLLVHSLFDFNLQIPSNALLFLFHAAVVSRIGATATERHPAPGTGRAGKANVTGFATGVLP